MGPQTVLEIIATKVVELTYVGLLGYGLHLTSAYLNHRLDVLGKDAFVFYRRDRYREESSTDDLNGDSLNGGPYKIGRS
jgi:hypothetical protein